MTAHLLLLRVHGASVPELRGLPARRELRLRRAQLLRPAGRRGVAKARREFKSVLVTLYSVLLALRNNIISGSILLTLCSV